MIARLLGAVSWRNKIRRASNTVRWVRGFFPLTLVGFLLLGISATTFWLAGIRR
jgi:hypothetical protein